MCHVFCDFCGEAVEDLENMIFDFALCHECHGWAEANFEEWMRQRRQ